MFINFLQIAIRNALRYKTYTLINILGLSIGITASILISLWVFDELSFDKYFQDADRMYRIDLYQQTPQTRTPYPMAQAMVQDFPEVLKATSLTPLLGPNFSKPTFAVEYQDVRFDEKNFFAGDTNFFDVFSFEFIMGNPNSAFLVPHAIIITREISEKYFGNENSIGKMLRINDELDFMVTGVLEDLPPNIHFHFDFMISYAFMKQMETGEWFTWSDPGHYNYIVLKPDANVSELQGKLPEWFMQYTDYGEQYEQQLTEGTTWFQLTPVRDIHLHSNIRWELETNGNISYVYIFLFSSLLILIVAIINYMNLSTARYSHKSREVAVRKTTGASRARLIQQFQVESFLHSLASVIIAVFFTEILINSFSNLTGKDFYLIYSQTEIYILVLLFLAVIIGLLTGSYPSFYLSSFSPLEVLRRKSHAGGSVVTIRIILVVFQFTASIFLIIGTLTIFNQLQFIRNKGLGFNLENLIVLPIKDDRIQSQIEQIKESLLQYPGIENISAVSNIPGGIINNNPLSLSDLTEQIEASEISVDYNYIETLGLKMAEGRYFQQDFGADSLTKFIINERAVQELGLESPVNTRVNWHDDDGTFHGEIIGVIEDFHYKSLHQTIQPLVLMVKPSEYNYLLVRINPARISGIINEIKLEWGKFDDMFTFEYSFLADEFDAQYGNEERMGRIYWIMAMLAVIIAMMGLFGLSTFSLEQKIQEIGVRKVHGATSMSILRMFYFDFSKWVLLAFIIASPLGYWGMKYWLRDFPYQKDPALWIFLAAGLITELIAIFAVSYQAIRASAMKPVDSLRYE